MATQPEREVVGSDIQVARIYIQPKPEFFVPGLEHFKPPRYIRPKNINALIDLLQDQQVLILGGSLEVDKAGLARHIAWYLGEILSTNIEAPLETNGFPILEWTRSPDRQGLQVGLQETTQPTIFILPQIIPQEVGYDLNRIQVIARKCGHYVIISTDTPFPAWKTPGKVPYWAELDPADLYTAQELCDVLLQNLAEAGEALPLELRNQALGRDSAVGGMPFLEIASRLRTPNNIAYFVELLCHCKKAIDPADLNLWIAQAQKKEDVFRPWFLNTLDTQEKLLVLGLGLFDDLGDDQFFSALDKVISQAWRPRDPALVLPDYHHLDNLRYFYSFAETQSGNKKITSRFPDQRWEVIKLGWEDHRRKFLAALPVLQELVKNSIQKRPTEPALYGNPARRKALRNTIGEALSEIGLLSVEAIEDILMDFAADQDGEVQTVAAQALARWRISGKDENLFDLLTRWQEDAHYRELVKLTLEGRAQENAARPAAYIRSTVALTVGYASLYDPPNRLSPQLISLLWQLAEDKNELVRDRFRGYTLPTVVPLHLEQLKPELYKMVKYVDLIQTIGACLGRAYRLTPDEVINILDGWEQEGQKNNPDYFDPEHITHRDALMATIAFAYGQIEYGSGNGPLTADRAFLKLQNFLESERHPFVRSAIVIAITFQAKYHFEKIEPQLKRLVMEVTPSEREEIVKIFSEIYLIQRFRLTGGDDTIEINNQSYETWNDPSKRPLTSIERAMFRWLNSDGNPIARQIATQAFVMFAYLFEQKEIHILDEKRLKAQQQAMREKMAHNHSLKDMPPLERAIRQSSIVASLAAWITTIRALRFRQRIIEILPEALTQRRSHPSAVDFVINRWRKTSDGTIQKTAQYLKRSVWLVESTARYSIPLLFILLFISCICCCLSIQLTDSIYRHIVTTPTPTPDYGNWFLP